MTQLKEKPWAQVRCNVPNRRYIHFYSLLIGSLFVIPRTTWKYLKMPLSSDKSITTNLYNEICAGTCLCPATKENGENFVLMVSYDQNIFLFSPYHYQANMVKRRTISMPRNRSYCQYQIKRSSRN